MIKIGLTGGIGSGKSTVAKIFNSLGIPVFNADLQARLLLNEDAKLIFKIKELFGDTIYENNELNRRKVAEMVFNDKDSLSKLNNLVHPAVKVAFEDWQKRQKTAYIIKEAAILIESGSYKNCDKIIVVTAPKEIRIKRVVNRDSIPTSEVEKRIANQLPESEKIKYADYIIQNDENDLLIPQVMQIHQKILNNA